MPVLQLHSLQMPRWLNVPNSFTLLRLALAPVVIRAILDGRHFAALAIFAIAAVTDILDGASARHFGIATTAGAVLDPIADKCLLSGVFLGLGLAGSMPWWLVGIVFGRDLYILLAAAAALLFTRIRKFPPSVWGKASTFVQIATVVLWMGRDLLPLPAFDTLAAAMPWPCAAFTVWSGIHYTWRGVHVIRPD
jgi:cardiolipin synthase